MENKICPIMSRPLTNLSGDNTSYAQMYYEYCLNEQCMAWVCTTEIKDLKMVKEEEKTGYCKLIDKR